MLHKVKLVNSHFSKFTEPDFSLEELSLFNLFYSEESVTCRAGNSTVGNTGPVYVTFDGAVRSSQNNFTYQPNPNVTDINPRSSIVS